MATIVLPWKCQQILTSVAIHKKLCTLSLYETALNVNIRTMFTPSPVLSRNISRQMYILSDVNKIETGIREVMFGLTLHKFISYIFLDIK